MFVKYLLSFIFLLFFTQIVVSQTSCNFAGFRGCAGTNICAHNTVPTINATYCITWNTNFASGSFCGFPPYNVLSPANISGCPKCGIFTVNPYFCLDATDGCIYWDDYYQMCTGYCKYKDCKKRYFEKKYFEN